MRLFKKTSLPVERPGWRQYQAFNQKRKGANRRRSRMVMAAVLLVTGAICYMSLSAFSDMTTSRAVEATGDPQPVMEPEAIRTVDPVTPTISKRDAQILLSGLPLEELIAEQAVLPFRGEKLKVVTSLDMGLQSYLVKSFDLKNSRYIGIVVMAAETGRILALAGFDKTDPQNNPCLENDFPAASIFKIITAAAAVDQFQYHADTRMQFNGYKHTLYKSQLKDQTNQYTHTVSFKDAFAQSVNPVFGKIGALRLGKSQLEQFAAAFGFNQPIDFELTVAPSRIDIKDDPYHWAEIASGFNKETTISPLHGAMMTTAVLNDGQIIAPTIVDRIQDPKGKLLYQSAPQWHGRAMSSRAAVTLAQMMETTVKSGTGRNSFRGMDRHPTLAHLQIGGKTGSISNRQGDVRFDWFAGFAREKNGSNGLVLSILVGHEAYIGVRAAEYARKAITRYYQDQLTHQNTQAAKTGG